MTIYVHECMTSSVVLFFLLYRFYAIGIYLLCSLLLIFILHWITSVAFFIDYGAYDSWEDAVGWYYVYM